MEQSGFLALDADSLVVKGIDGGAFCALHVLAVVGPGEWEIGGCAGGETGGAHAVVCLQAIEGGAADNESASGSHVGIGDAVVFHLVGKFKGGIGFSCVRRAIYSVDAADTLYFHGDEKSRIGFVHLGE